jgi:hypothetical protein
MKLEGNEYFVASCIKILLEFIQLGVGTKNMQSCQNFRICKYFKYMHLVHDFHIHIVNKGENTLICVKIQSNLLGVTEIPLGKE